MEPPRTAPHHRHLTHRKLFAVLTALLLLAVSAPAQVSPAVSRITRRLDNAERVALPGHIVPRTRTASDRGRVPASLELSLVTLELAQTDSQTADLESLLAEQQDPSSPNYHQWLTPEQYADRFGASADDIARIVAWLQDQGLTVVSVARGRNSIAVNGTAAQFEHAFSTELHQYIVDGEPHFANATEPSIPAAAFGVVRSIRGLNDFRMKSASVTAKYTHSGSLNHYIAPDDFATIYNVRPAYAAGITGAGQKIVIAGQTGIDLSDIQTFQSSYNLPANLPQVTLIPGSKDPGVNGDLAEADLDLEWTLAIARNASVVYVYSKDVLQSVQYAINQNLAPVISLSYGSCELASAPSDARNFQSWARQANAQGITWFNATGDSGAADCYTGDNTIQQSVQDTPAVDLPSSVPEITGVGGTEFQEGSTRFWNDTNDANGASALSYVPETAWNDPTVDGEPSASGGGASTFFAKPSWQIGPGVPADNARHVPDIAASASAEHVPYLIYSGGDIVAIGGTSAPTPAFAGVAALLNQYLVSTGKQKVAGLGNINPQLYALAISTPAIFHDVTTGANTVTEGPSCGHRASCTTATVNGFNAGAGYDSVTGLGSMDVWKLLSCWSSGSVCLSLVSNLATAGPGDSITLSVTATSNNGLTPVGTVQFSAGNTSLGSATLVGSAGIATASLTITGSQLPTGSSTITASFNGATSSTSLQSRTTSATFNPALSGLTNGASFQQIYSPGMILAAFGSDLAATTAGAGAVPLPVTIAGVAATVNGVSAPLYYVSPSQLNIQIPYETAGGDATLTVNNNGVVTSKTFQIAASSPGIFADLNGTLVPNGSATAGQITTLYLTGSGAVTPVLATGSAPSLTTALIDLPKPPPGAAVAVTVRGAAAAIQFIGIPYGLVGVTQINFQVPAGVPTGVQPVVVTVDGVSSPPVNINITN